MKDLLLIRHAKSSWAFPDLKDDKRPLNDRGNRDAPRMAKFCKMKGLHISHLISSPAKRAFSTAEYFHIEHNTELSQETDLYFGDENDWMHIINNLNEDVKLPAFFSHNPTITFFANSFIGNYIENIPTCGIVHLQSKIENWSDLHYDNTEIKNIFFPKTI